MDTLTIKEEEVETSEGPTALGESMEFTLSQLQIPCCRDLIKSNLNSFD